MIVALCEGAACSQSGTQMLHSVLICCSWSNGHRVRLIGLMLPTVADHGTVGGKGIPALSLAAGYAGDTGVYTSVPDLGSTPSPRAGSGDRFCEKQTLRAVATVAATMHSRLRRKAVMRTALITYCGQSK